MCYYSEGEDTATGLFYKDDFVFGIKSWPTVPATWVRVLGDTLELHCVTKCIFLIIIVKEVLFCFLGFSIYCNVLYRVFVPVNGL